MSGADGSDPETCCWLPGKTGTNHQPIPYPLSPIPMIPWTDAEKDMIKQHYTESGTRVLRNLMPRRNPNAIRMMAAALGVQYSFGRRNKKAKRWTPEQDALLRLHYGRIRKRSDPMTREILAKMVDASPLQVIYRAIVLGLARQTAKQPDWSEEEDEFLVGNVGKSIEWLKRALIKRGFPQRSDAGIASRRKRLGAAVVGNGSTYSAGELGRLMGTSSRTVTNWIARGLLDAKPRTGSIDPNHGGVGDRWEITPAAVRRFVLKHSSYVELGQVDKYWFLAMMETEQSRAVLRQESCGVADD